jgi:hypothetical protein
MIPDDEPFVYHPVAETKPHDDTTVEWLEAHKPRPFGVEW